jgi:hypothetical protein
MREKPILFSGPMVRAILDGRKTQTRRVIKNKDIINGFDIDIDGSAIAYIDQATGDSYPPTIKSPYQPGDRLWVRETWTPFCINKQSCRNVLLSHADYCYKATFPKDCVDTLGCTWRPSIYMPKAAARIWLEVIDVRVEMLQEITEEDAIKEGFTGVPCEHPNGRYACEDCMNTGWREPPRVGFVETWQALNAKRGYGWDTNPWVFVVEFKRLEGE